MYFTLSAHVNAAVDAALAGDGKCAEALKSAVSDSKRDIQESFPTFTAVDDVVEQTSLHVLCEGIDKLTAFIRQEYRLEDMENPLPLTRNALITIVSRVQGFLFPLELALARGEDTWGFRNMMTGSLAGMRIAQKIGTTMTERRLRDRAGRVIGGQIAHIPPSATFSEPLLKANYEITVQALEEILIELARKQLNTPSDVTVALHRVLSKNGWNTWLHLSVRDLLSRYLPEMILEEGQVTLIAPAPDGHCSLGEIKTVTQFQSYIAHRIQAHANRVEEFRLASSVLDHPPFNFLYYRITIKGD
ncbi:hypothetical protein FRC07_009083 [Ceratobasidium sp. 392]|nr:hypothetical protein FRC07_009083 [Ceratobasidium sp. 392]